MASVERTAYPRFKRTVSSRELHESFTPGPSEVAWAQGKARSAEHVLALVVLLKSYQKLGHFPDLAEVPELVVGHVRGLLGLGEGVAPTHDSARTLRHHRTVVRERLGVVYDQEKAREIAAAAIYEAVQTKDNPADLINVALEELVKARLELPGHTTLDEMAAAIRTKVNEDFFARVVSRMDEVEQVRLLALLRVVAGSRSKFDELKRPAKAPTVSHLRDAACLRARAHARCSAAAAHPQLEGPDLLPGQPTVKYQHIDPLFGDPEKDVINWRLIENHFEDLMRVVLSIREGKLSSAALLRRLGNESRRNRIYQAYQELGRVIRTIVLLRFLSEPGLRESIQAMTNKVEAFHKFSNWLMFASDILQDNDPVHQEKIIKFNELLANCLIFPTAQDITKVVNDLVDEGWEADPVDLATVTPYITSKIRRFGTWHLDMEPPEQEAMGRLRMAA
ncbi:Tn3 family transposase [Streptomyces prasinopilosus]|uniref:Tn3 transposase DDE domain-containing protein n=1 Tax=Streptomyces prasinopilosus TaxID=67344 RepID=A0A1G6K7E9_9ACTN|nr:Tn3 family transposase [Streptomyces prasinopilosus]SDC26982.1 protein of unknown function [Streptomyces prasinopilosus]